MLRRQAQAGRGPRISFRLGSLREVPAGGRSVRTQRPIGQGPFPDTSGGAAGARRGHQEPCGPGNYSGRPEARLPSPTPHPPLSSPEFRRSADAPYALAEAAPLPLPSGLKTRIGAEPARGARGLARRPRKVCGKGGTGLRKGGSGRRPAAGHFETRKGGRLGAERPKGSSRLTPRRPGAFILSAPILHRLCRLRSSGGIEDGSYPSPAIVSFRCYPRVRGGALCRDP